MRKRSWIRKPLWLMLVPLVAMSVPVARYNFTEERFAPLGRVQGMLGINQGTCALGEAPVRVGHRGSGVGVVENSFGAIRKGLDAGMDWIEIDVRSCEDGLVVFHDATTERVFGGDDQARVETLTMAELLEMQGPVSEDDRVRTLDEVLGYFAGEGVNWILDIKEPGLRGGVLQVLAAHGLSPGDQVMILGQDAIVQEFKGSGYGLCYAVGWSEGWNKIRMLGRHSFVLRRCRDLGPEFRGVALPDIFVRESLVRDLRAQGVSNVWVYLAEEPESWERVLKLGATGIIADDVDRLKEFRPGESGGPIFHPAFGVDTG